MRIIAGAYGGRKLVVSKGFDSRPTTDFAREALFNILSNHFEFSDIRILDLFSGTGSISLEFASRGCTEIDLVEFNTQAVRFIGRIAEDLGIKGIHPVRMDVFRFVPICKKKYHIIFADPPYDLKNLKEIPDLVLHHDLLMQDGWFILEHGKSNDFKTHPRFFDQRHYGSVYFTFFR